MFRSLLSSSGLLARGLGLCAVLLASGGFLVAGGPDWRTGKMPWERSNYEGYSESHTVPLHTAPANYYPQAEPEKYVVKITSPTEKHTYDDPNAVMLVAHLPADARFFVGGEPTTQTGTVRYFVSPALPPGKVFHYTVRVDWVENGKQVSQTERIPVQAGEIHCVDIVPAAAHKKFEADIAAELGKLSPEDKELAVAQKFCAVQGENRLGEMGVPIKLMVKGKPVFICCEACKKKALENADQTLAQVETLKHKHSDKK
jgi:uncharacterized protein (TIGR03000 family)